MGTWVELRCSIGSAPDCVSTTNEGPQAMMPDGAAQVAAGLRALTRAARRRGWRRETEVTSGGARGGWVCPACRVAVNEPTQREESNHELP